MTKAEPLAASRTPRRSEVIADGVVHAIGLLAAAAGSAALITMAVLRGDVTAVAAILVYSAGLITMLACSANYNLRLNSPQRPLFCCLDQSAIFAMIAGSYTPFTLLHVDRALSIPITIVIWLLAVLSIALRLFRPATFVRYAIALYLALGWIGLLIVEPLFHSLGMPIMLLLLAGGLLYTIGVVFHLWERLPYQSAIWHGFVVAAAGTHFTALAAALASRASST